MAGSNMFADEGLRIAAGAFVGAKSDTITGAVGEAPLFGLVNHGYTPPGGLVAVNRPIAISQIRIKWVTVTPFAVAQGLAFDVHKTTATTNYTNGKVVVAQRKKFSDYPAIPSSEIDIKVAEGVALTGGNQVEQGSVDAPFDLAAIGGTTIPSGETIWEASDGLPFVLEQGEGLIVHNVVSMGADGVGMLFVGINFYRF